MGGVVLYLRLKKSGPSSVIIGAKIFTECIKQSFLMNVCDRTFLKENLYVAQVLW